MTVSSFPFRGYPFSFRPNPSYARAFKVINSAKLSSSGTALTILPARDRVIDFGKHKGKMLGTLPSTYLKWVSKNLRARDFEEWAKLADEVLEDPIYQDRIEWEFAENILSGNNRVTFSAIERRNEISRGVVAELLEISERFGWDNNDKSGWKNINVELLGTSKGGRIPRINNGDGKGEERSSEWKSERENGSGGAGTGTGKRRERRERQKMRMKREESKTDGEEKWVMDKSGSRVDERFVMDGIEIKWNENENTMEKPRNPFPGREALLQKVMNRRRK